MVTFCFSPVAVWTRSLINVSVTADTSLMLPLSQIAVSMQWASKSPVTPLPAAAASRRQSFTALREVGADGPVLQEVRTVMEDLAELAAVNDLLGEGHGGHAAVVVPHGVGHAGFLDGVDHRLAFSAVRASGFSQSTILPASAAAMATSAC